MKKYLHYFIQGWKFQFAMLLFNVCVAVALLPIAFLVDLDKGSYYAIAITVYIVALVPIGGLLAWWLRPIPSNASDMDSSNA